ncbi:hypothetical protein M5D96_007040, partial [Drosophila gunungcola]
NNCQGISIRGGDIGDSIDPRSWSLNTRHPKKKKKHKIVRVPFAGDLIPSVAARSNQSHSHQLPALVNCLVIIYNNFGKCSPVAEETNQASSK